MESFSMENRHHLGFQMVRLVWRVPRKKVTKTDLYLGLYRIRLFVFLTLYKYFTSFRNTLLF